MFNGIINYIGTVKNIKKIKKGLSININSKLPLKQNEIGSSISCSGACLTLTNLKKNISTFYVSQETLKVTNLSLLKISDKLNLEKSLKYGDRISGHFIQGHVDTTAIVKKIKYIGKSWLVDFKISKKYLRFIVQKGSIAVNGVSLTISKKNKSGFRINIIPHTLRFTNLMQMKEKDIVNIEIDIVAKYIKSLSK